MLYLLRPDQAANEIPTVQKATLLLTIAPLDHWHFCNIYTIRERERGRHIIKHICDIYDDFKNNFQTRKAPKTGMEGENDKIQRVVIKYVV